MTDPDDTPRYLLDAAYEYGRGWGHYDYSHGHIHFAGTAGYTGTRLDAYRAGYDAGWVELEKRVVA